MAKPKWSGLVSELCGTSKNHTPFYNAWIDMRQRCANPHRKDWPHYGERGIVVCARWDDFSAFVEDMYPSYQPGLSLDRIDNDGPYSPENCHWATNSEQARNRTNNHIIEGMIITDWAKMVGLKRGTVHWRLKMGWSIERIRTTPARKIKRP
jgi:hypothetical protein